MHNIYLKTPPIDYTVPASLQHKPPFDYTYHLTAQKGRIAFELLANLRPINHILAFVSKTICRKASQHQRHLEQGGPSDS